MSGMTTVIFIHGCGQSTKGFSDPAWTFLLETYQRLRPGQTLEADRVEFLYDSVFEEFRAAPKDALAQIALLTGDTGIQSFLKDLQQSDQFVYTHVLDVLLWRFHAHVRNVITTDLGAKLMPYLKTIAGTAEANLVLVPHSLGTAVMNEVVHFAAGTGATKYLAIPSIHMLANVSKVLERPELQAYNPPSPSLCRPLTGGAGEQGAALQHYFTYWNQRDPIPQVDRFKPSWSDSIYHDTRFSALGAGVSPHDLNTYVQAPEVYMPLLRSITLDPNLDQALEAQEISAAQGSGPLVDAARKALLEQVSSSIQDGSGLVALLKLLRALHDSGF